MGRLKAGDFVRFNVENGSTGIVVGVRDDGPFARDPRYYVRIYSGLDVKGEPMTDSAGLRSRGELVEITAAEFNEVAMRKGWDGRASVRVLQGLIHLAMLRGGDTLDDKIPVVCGVPYHQARSIHRDHVTCLACKARYEVIGGQPAQKKEEPESTTQPCPACKFENEWGSEEVPHPIDPRVHECVIQKGQEAVDDALAKYREGLLLGYKRMPTVVGRLYATANIGDDALEWQVACTKALMESQERLAAEVVAATRRANFNERRWQECAADYAKERARRQELEQRAEQVDQLVQRYRDMKDRFSQVIGIIDATRDLLLAKAHDDREPCWCDATGSGIHTTSCALLRRLVDGILDGLKVAEDTPADRLAATIDELREEIEAEA